MKMFNCLKARSRKFHRGALAATLLGLACFAGMNSQAASLSPIGVWDCKISGANQGVGFLAFGEDFSLTGIEVITATLPPATSSDRGSTDVGRNDGDTSSNTASNLFGTLNLSGTWSFDSQGRIIGVLSEFGSQLDCSITTNTVTISITNVVDGTNVIYSYTTNGITTICVTNSTTNGFSFVAKVRPNHLALQATGVRGKVNFSGIFPQEVPDLTGNYYGFGRKQGSPNFTEFLSFSATESPYLYDVTAQTATAVLTGQALVSSQKRLALSLITDTNSVESVSTGSINFRNKKSSLSTQFGDKTTGNLRLFPN